MMLKWEVCGNTPMPNLNSKKIEEYCKQINDLLYDNSKALEYFGRGISKLDLVVTGLSDTEITKSKQLLENCKSKYFNPQKA